MPDPYYGEIRMFAGNFAPEGWALCDGRLMNARTHVALFAILGTTYGGDGVNNYALPDLRGRMPLGAGQGPGLPNYELGQKVDGATTPGGGPAGLAVNFIISLGGTFPQRG
jgi:microcystin-dependent protein